MAIDYNDVERTELVWPGKRTEVQRVVLPFQTVETLSEPRMAQRPLDTGEWPEDYPQDWRNQLIWGDNKYVMSSLLPEFEGKIDLIYIDPPFATGADFSLDIEVGEGLEVTKEASVIEELAYRDTWGKGLQSYLQMIHDRLVLMHKLLSKCGSICIHLDEHVSHYVKALMDEVLGADHFINEIVWRRVTAHGARKGCGRIHDSILWYGKEVDYFFQQPGQPLRPEYIEQFYRYTEGNGRRYRLVSLTAKGSGPARRFGDEEIAPPPGTHWRWAQYRINDAWHKGLIVISEAGAIHYKQYLDEHRYQPVQSIWDDEGVRYLGAHSRESVGFETQKPEGLVGRIVKMCSMEGDLVADFFCGSGTTGVAAEKLGRRWIMSDLSKYAIHITRKRLLNLHNDKNYEKPCRPFVIQNLGSYQKHKFIENDHPPVKEYQEFILELYEAQPLEGYAFLQGRKGKRLVHIAGIDSVVTVREVEDTAQECKNAAGGESLDILGWDFELGLDQEVADVEEMYGLKIKLKLMPREAAELKDIAEAGKHIRFFDLNYLELEHKVEGRRLEIGLADFMLANPEYVPQEVREQVQSFSDYIDYWAVDFDYQDDTFHNGWQSFRTRQDRSLDIRCIHHYDDEGRRTVLVKVIDIFGNDTNKAFEVNIGE